MPVLATIDFLLEIDYHKGMPVSAQPLNPQKNSGFTLIELMVAISIIALLSAIGLTVFSQAQIAARDGKRLADMQEVQKALEQYYAVNQTYPAAPGSGNVKDLTGAANSFLTYFQNTAPPADPNIALSGSEYKYYACASPVGYNICSRMENCSGKCNMTTTSLPNGCSQVGAPGSVTSNTTGLYCLKSLSN